MSLDPKYISVNTFQEVFVDKDTGCGMTGGVVKFYQDNSRTTTKEVFKLSGTPPNYTYVSLGTELTLSSVGTFQDGFGNDITVYLYPYDASGNIQLYYATVENAGAISQFTREGFPNLTAGEEEEGEIPNYISNPQFLLHHELTPDPDGVYSPTELGEIVASITIVAEGGWEFARDSGSTAKDYVTFTEFGSYVAIPSKSPKFAIRVENQVSGTGNTYKELRIIFNDVNKFASDDKFFTFAFEGLSVSGSTSNVDVVLLKYFGIGGSPTEKTILQNIELSTSYTIYDIPFKFGINDGKTIGAGSFVALVISFPLGNTFQDEFTNFLLTDDDLQLTSFPNTTNEKMITDSLAGQFPIPSYTNQYIYLPIVLGYRGYTYDMSLIGRGVISFDDLTYENQVRGDGQKLRVDAYSQSLIPYRRLYNVYSSASEIGLGLYGTGRDEVIMLNKTTLPTALYELRSTTAGAVTPAGNGVVSPGFTFTPVQPDPYIVDILFVAASTITAGSYWIYHTTDARKYIIWQEVDGSGTQPVESAGVYIKVILSGTDPATTVALKNAKVINGYSVGVPDIRGYFLRNKDGGAGVDPDAVTRLPRPDDIGGDVVGSIQEDTFKTHIHIHTHTFLRTYDEGAGPGNGYQPLGGGFGNIRQDTTDEGGLEVGDAETRAKNIYMRLLIYI